MAFKKREYNYWMKLLKQAFNNCIDPYWFKRYLYEAFSKEENYEGMKAANDVFEIWYSKWQMSESQLDEYLSNYYKHHPVYGDGYLPELKHP